MPTRNKTPPKKLVKIVCPKCKQFLAETLPTADVLCRKCKRWVSYGGGS